MSPDTSKNTEAAKSKKSGKESFLPSSPGAVEDTLSLQADDPVERRYFRRSLILIGGAFLVMLFFFFAAFFLAVRGAERTVIPQVVDADLDEAIEMLQERELYPRLQTKFTGDPADKGRVISQDPEPGLYVKAGRRVTITVSKGAIVDEVEDYVGKSITEVRGRLTSLFSTFEPLLVIREPITYVYDDSEAGMVLSQTPPAETPLGDPQELILIVSRGSLDRPIILPDYEDYSADNAMRSLARIPLPFVFVEDAVEPTGYVARVTSQRPAPEAQVGADGRITLRFSKPEAWPEDSAYGLFEHVLPDYPVPVLLEVAIREPGADDRTLFSMPHPGGALSFPYVLPAGSAIIVTVNGDEAVRRDVLSDS